MTLGTLSVENNISYLAAALEKDVRPLLDSLAVESKGPQDQPSFALRHLAGTIDVPSERRWFEGATPT
jgi:hypothetical protein